jgi:outer membrane protein assembly factor BamB
MKAACLHSESRMRLPIAIFGLVTFVGCGDRTPPPGSGALETTPTGSTSRALAPALASMPAALTFPNGSVVTTDPKACRIALLRDGMTLWERESSGCGGLLEACIAMDSVVYVRTEKEVAAFAPDGTLRFATKLTDAPPPRTLAAPTSLADSRVALAATSKTLIVYERDGRVSWSFSPPSDEVLIAPPVGMKTEGIILMTSQGVYYLGAGGETRWRAAGAIQVAR